jgi:Na+-transporting NADH:ubiquinone oxidoreductase subunit NqrB
MAQSFGRKGFSRGAGQYSLGAAQGAKNYTANMAQAQATRMNDAFGNATQQLGETSRNEQFGTALAGLAEDDRNQSMASLQEGYNLLNGLFGGFGGSRPG